MQQGYIKLHRQLMNWRWYTNITVKTVFLHCLLRANHTDRDWESEELEKGSFVTSYENLAKETGLSTQQVRTAINKLKSTNEITYQSNRQYSIITVNNWDKFQDSNKPINKRLTNEQQTINKRLTTDNNDNNERMIKNDNIISINVEKIKKTDPYINPLINKFKELHEKIIGKRVYLNAAECNKLTELAADVEDFSSTLPTVLKKLKNLKFDGIGYKPNASWLLKDNHYTEILNGAYDYESREQIVARLEEEEIRRRKLNEKN